jgi:hypothetical protein
LSRGTIVCEKSLTHSLVTNITGSRHKFRVIASLSWKPFNAPFEDLLSKFTLHREVIEDEIQLAEYKKVLRRNDIPAEQLLLHAEEKVLLLETKKRLQEAKKTLEEISKSSQDKYRGPYEQ